MYFLHQSFSVYLFPYPPLINKRLGRYKPSLYLNATRWANGYGTIIISFAKLIASGATIFQVQESFPKIKTQNLI
jgi:hypothetical protein